MDKITNAGYSTPACCVYRMHAKYSVLTGSFGNEEIGNEFNVGYSTED